MLHTENPENKQNFSSVGSRFLWCWSCWQWHKMHLEPTEPKLCLFRASKFQHW
jgi:hypothetical protein